jgi:glycosyltransferase involved in cell wall biosynthesis
MPAGVALVIPVFQHSVLLFDALHSCDVEAFAAVIIIDDGCPHIETQFAGIGLAAIYSNVTYLRGGNRGLSGARNCGIEFVLRHLPHVTAIYFLDADNMLSAWSLPQMEHMLHEYPDDHWFYPDIRMFGLEWEASYAGDFLPLLETIDNICEAGSLVRRTVFENGLRFSEQLKLGFEDWDFWLSAIEHGFRGRHFASSGFRYRKRPESMLANSERDKSFIHGQLDRRHPWLRDIRWATTAEHVTLPRYAIYLSDLNLVRFSSSADLSTEEISGADYVARFWAALRAPKTCYAGAFLIVTSSANMSTLHAAKILSWSFHDMERRLRDCNIAALSLGRNSDRSLTCHPPTIGASSAAVAVAVSMELLRRVAMDSSDVWLKSVVTDDPQPRLSARHVDLPVASDYAMPLGDMLRELLRICTELRLSPFAGAASVPGEDATLGTPDRAQIGYRLRTKFGGGLLPPELSRQDHEIAFAVPRFAFGGVEKVTMFAARALRRRGYRVSLMLLKTGDLLLADEFDEAFDRVFFLDNQEFESWTGPRYFGTALSRWSVSGAHADELNLFSAFDAVIACHAADVLGLLGDLRRRGAVTATYNHLFDVTPSGRNCGHPHLTLAYEHVLDMFICCSDDIALTLHGHGVPADKIVIVPNAAGITIPLSESAESLAGHLKRDGGKLRVLFVGRIDHQKGLDRLLMISRRLRAQGLADIRIVGSPVLSNDQWAVELAEMCEDPLNGAQLLEAYAWADILILPSLYEGLPLTLIEAMQMATVPIAAGSGAIGEVIEHGVNGFIVSQDHCVIETISLISELYHDRPRLHQLMQAAAATNRNWDDAIEPLDAALQRAFARRTPRRNPAILSDVVETHVRMINTAPAPAV